jgi:hypothetical protein
VTEFVPATENEVVSVFTVCPVDQVGVPVEQAGVSETLWPTVVVSELAATAGVFVTTAVNVTIPVALLTQPLTLVQNNEYVRIPVVVVGTLTVPPTMVSDALSPISACPTGQEAESDKGLFRHPTSAVVETVGAPVGVGKIVMLKPRGLDTQVVLAEQTAEILNVPVVPVETISEPALMDAGPLVITAVVPTGQAIDV